MYTRRVRLSGCAFGVDASSQRMSVVASVIEFKHLLDRPVESGFAPLLSAFAAQAKADVRLCIAGYVLAGQCGILSGCVGLA